MEQSTKPKPSRWPYVLVSIVLFSFPLFILSVFTLTGIFLSDCSEEGMECIGGAMIIWIASFFVAIIASGSIGRFYHVKRYGGPIRESPTAATPIGRGRNPFMQ